MLPEEVQIEALDKRIAFVRESLARLTREAAEGSASADGHRNEERIAGEQALLDDLLRQREALEP